MKKKLYFVRYLISKCRDFSRIFLNFLETFQIFEHIYKNATIIFNVKIYRNAPLIFEVRNLQKCHSDF